MDVKIIVFLVIVISVDISYGQRVRGRNPGQHKKQRQHAMNAGKQMVSMNEQIKELKKLVDSLPRNVVHIHVHDGGNDDEHHHERHHGNDVTNNDNSNETSSRDTQTGVVNENEQHIHMYMHLETDDHHDYHDHHKGHGEKEIHIHCEVVPNSKLQDGDDVRGHIHMIQKGDEPVHIYIGLGGFDMTKENAPMTHGIHIHTYGDMSESCESLGSHFNPDDTVHAGKDAHIRHIGDLGNIGCNMKGEIDHHMTDDRISLHGKDSIIGRSIAVHYGPDDMGLGGNAGSIKGGNAGPKVACCIIARADPAHHQHHSHSDVKTETGKHSHVKTETGTLSDDKSGTIKHSDVKSETGKDSLDSSKIIEHS